MSWEPSRHGFVDKEKRFALYLERAGRWRFDVVFTMPDPEFPDKSFFTKIILKNDLRTTEAQAALRDFVEEGDAGVRSVVRGAANKLFESANKMRADALRAEEAASHLLKEYLS